MSIALGAKNLGKCAALMQQRNNYLPFATHKALRKLRQVSYVHHRRVSVTPPACVLYAVYHITLGILRVGQTHMAPIQRLRKHMTDAAASALHLYM